MNIRLVAYTSGFLLMALGGLMFVPLAFEIYDGTDNANAFFSSAIATMFVGGLFFLSCRDNSRTIEIRDAFLLTIVSWCTLCLFGSFPIYMSDLSPSFTNAFFESVSGLTTTGATAFSGLDQMSRGVLIWRAILQWLGGIGVIGMAIAILLFWALVVCSFFEQNLRTAQRRSCRGPGSSLLRF